MPRGGRAEDHEPRLLAAGSPLHDPGVIVMKFGGTSVGDARSIERVVRIVRDQLSRRPLVVVSAHAGVTDALLEVARQAPLGRADTQPIAALHRRILRDLGLPAELLDPLLGDLQDLARGLRLVGTLSPKAQDQLLSFGERCSARTVAGALAAAGVPATAVDAFAAGLRTDGAFGRARPLPDDGRIRTHLAQVAGVPVVTGFIGADEAGNITTLGRNGSDFTAALFGAAVGAEEIQIWKDVDGVRTADPRLVPAALPIPDMTFDEACELASFGSKVLHPAAMVPAMQNGIPLRVRNTLDPASPGTTIALAAKAPRPAVRAISHRAGIALVTLTSQRLVPQHVFLARVFGELAELGRDVVPVAVSEAAVTFAVDETAVAQDTQRLAALGELRVEPGQAVVGVVGDPRALESGIAASALQTLAEAGIAVRCAGQGALGSTVACVVAKGELSRAVTALHGRFFR